MNSRSPAAARHSKLAHQLIQNNQADMLIWSSGWGRSDSWERRLLGLSHTARPCTGANHRHTASCMCNTEAVEQACMMPRTATTAQRHPPPPPPPTSVPCIHPVDGRQRPAWSGTQVRDTGKRVITAAGVPNGILGPHTATPSAGLLVCRRPPTAAALRRTCGASSPRPARRRACPARPHGHHPGPMARSERERERERERVRE